MPLTPTARITVKYIFADNSLVKLLYPSINMRIDITDKKLQESAFTLCHMIKEAGGRAFFVGGCVRDSILGISVKDIDIEVFGLQPYLLKKLLESKFRVDLVGEAFSVFKIHEAPIDVSLPRKETKTGERHQDFDVYSDPFLPFEKAAARRDFTINAIMYDPLKDEILDPFNGRSDLKNKILRHTSGKFVEDPLRVLRGMQFAGRFELKAAAETVKICSEMTQEALPPERIFGEWKKLILESKKPSMGLVFLKNAGWLKFYPELEALCGCEQEQEWHPEGDVWIHTLYSMDGFAKERTGIELEDLIVGFAVLCHDFGKPITTCFEDGRLRSRGHETAGEEPTRKFMMRMTNQEDLIEDVIVLVRTHLRPRDLYDNNAGDSAIRRLARQVKRIDRLVRVAKADRMGIPPFEKSDFPAGEWLLKRAAELEVVDSKPKPIIMGRHLLELGVKPGPEMGQIIDELYEQQLDGKFFTVEEGLNAAKKLINNKNF